MQTAVRPVEQALAEAQERFVRRNPRSLALHQEAQAAMPGGNTRTVLYHAPFPLRVARGEGGRLWDVDGHAYLDFLGEYTAGLYGHSHPVIRQAVLEALDEGISLAGHNVRELRLAQAVQARFGLGRVRFTNSGTEANLMALAAARVYTGRGKILVFEGGYHGGVLYFGGGGSPVNVPHAFVVAPYNDAAAALALIAEHAGDLAAVLVEPMLGSGGCIPAEPDFLTAVAEAARAAGALLILDEVMTSRLAPGGMQALLGLRPDLTTLGKYLGGGLSFGAFGGRAEVMDLFDPGRPDALPHAGTFNNNVLSMAAGHAGLTRVYTPEAARALNARGDLLRGRLNELARQHGAPFQFTGRGSMLGVHTTPEPILSPRDAAKSDPQLKDLLFFDLNEAGVWYAKRGMMTLSLPLTDADCEHLAGAFAGFLRNRRGLLG